MDIILKNELWHSFECSKKTYECPELKYVTTVDPSL